MTTKGNIRSIQCPKMVLHNYAHNMLILQAHLCATMLTEKVCFFGRMALWHQITHILTKLQVDHALTWLCTPCDCPSPLDMRMTIA